VSEEKLMALLLAAAEVRWLPIAWTVLAMLAALGALALVSPRWFTTLALRGGRWVETEPYLNKLNTRVEIDQLVLPYSRWLGAATLAAVGTFGWLLSG
jgi:hypothetical protein